LLAEGVGIETIADVLGHSSVVLTASTYAKVLDAGKSAALDRGAAALAQPVRRGA
jgi:integrase